MRDERTSGAVIAIALVAVLVMLPSLYVLSSGPAIWMYHHDYLGGRTLVIVYYPLEALAGSNEFVASTLQTYLNLWRPYPPYPD